MSVRPFVDFYTQNKISPVAQDIADFGAHLDRRGSLYRLLGIAPGAVRGRSVIEFGPGSGHNAVATAAFEPAQYVFVDANPTGIERLHGLLHQYAPGLSYRVDTSLIEAYASDERFDLVICEGVIPFQLDPSAFARHVASFARPGGLVSLTTIDAVSFLGDLGRRAIADRLVSPALPAPERVAALVPYFSADAAALAGMNRPLEDYLYDNIVQPLVGAMFSIADAVSALADAYDFFGSSPSFVTDWRWFKRMTGPARDPNPRVIDAYRRTIVNLLDSRIEVAPHDPDLGDAVLAHAAGFYADLQRIERGDAASYRPLAAAVEAIARLVEPLAPSTTRTLAALAAALDEEHPRGLPGEPVRSFFGRGMQYVSFVRRAQTAGT